MCVCVAAGRGGGGEGRVKGAWGLAMYIKMFNIKTVEIYRG